MGIYSIGVDLGGTNLRIAAVDIEGKLLEKLTTGTEVGRGRDSVIGEMCEAIQSVDVKFRDFGQLAGIGIGVPGFIDMDSGTIMESPNLPGWANFPVRDDIQRRLGTPVILENDANAAAMGEKWLGAGRDVDHMAMYTLGTGVGGGLGVERTPVARHERHGRRARTLLRRTARACLWLWQPWLFGTIRLGDSDCTNGA